MIKKHTTAIFTDGAFKGAYDWKGGIPLSAGEHMTVNYNNEVLQYVLISKDVVCDAEQDEQIVNITFTFALNV